MTKRNSEVASFGVELSGLELHAEKGRRVMVGYASAFNYPIPEYDGGTTFFDPGAWKRTLNNNRGDIQVLYHHGMDPQIGEKPLGVPRVMEEHDKGLWTETPLASTKYNEETIIPLLESGALRSMSVQFAAIASRHADDGRHITEAALREFGPTPFPRNLGASAALHSHSLGEFLATGAESPDNPGDEQHQPESPVTAARLTWSMNAMRSLENWERDQEALEARIARLERGGQHGDNAGAHQGASRPA
jgi:HK97 family phage prohead protease